MDAPEDQAAPDSGTPPELLASPQEHPDAAPSDGTPKLLAAPKPILVSDTVAAGSKGIPVEQTLSEDKYIAQSSAQKVAQFQQDKSDVPFADLVKLHLAANEGKTMAEANAPSEWWDSIKHAFGAVTSYPQEAAGRLAAAAALLGIGDTEGAKQSAMSALPGPVAEVAKSAEHTAEKKTQGGSPLETLWNDVLPGQTLSGIASTIPKFVPMATGAIEMALQSQLDQPNIPLTHDQRLQLRAALGALQSESVHYANKLSDAARQATGGDPEDINYKGAQFVAEQAPYALIPGGAIEGAAGKAAGAIAKADALVGTAAGEVPYGAIAKGAAKTALHKTPVLGWVTDLLTKKSPAAALEVPKLDVWNTVKDALDMPAADAVVKNLNDSATKAAEKGAVAEQNLNSLDKQMLNQKYEDGSFMYGDKELSPEAKKVRELNDAAESLRERTDLAAKARDMRVQQEQIGKFFYQKLFESAGYAGAGGLAASTTSPPNDKEQAVMGAGMFGALHAANILARVPRSLDEIKAGIDYDALKQEGDAVRAGDPMQQAHDEALAKMPEEFQKQFHAAAGVNALVGGGYKTLFLPKDQFMQRAKELGSDVTEEATPGITDRASKTIILNAGGASPPPLKVTPQILKAMKDIGFRSRDVASMPFDQVMNVLKQRGVDTSNYVAPTGLDTVFHEATHGIFPNDSGLFSTINPYGRMLDQLFKDQGARAQIQDGWNKYVDAYNKSVPEGERLTYSIDDNEAAVKRELTSMLAERVLADKGGLQRVYRGDSLRQKLSDAFASPDSSPLDFNFPYFNNLAKELGAQFYRSGEVARGQRAANLVERSRPSTEPQGTPYQPDPEILREAQAAFKKLGVKGDAVAAAAAVNARGEEVTPEAVVKEALKPQQKPDLKPAQIILGRPISDTLKNSRPVTREEFDRLGEEGDKILAGLRSNESEPTGLNEKWDAIKSSSYEEAKKPWGGATINAKTGEAIHPKSGYALSVKLPGQETISIPENASPEEFNAAMDRAKGEFANQMSWDGGHLGVFHDDAKKTIDIDPILVMDKAEDVHKVGIATHAVGGAYDFSTGNGEFPPHVPENYNFANQMGLQHIGRMGNLDLWNDPRYHKSTIATPVGATGDEIRAKAHATRQKLGVYPDQGTGRLGSPGIWDDLIANTSGEEAKAVLKTLGLEEKLADKHWYQLPKEARDKIAGEFKATKGADFKPESLDRATEADKTGAIEEGEPPWSIQLRRLNDKSFNGKLTPAEEQQQAELHDRAKAEFGSYNNWFDQYGAKPYLQQSGIGPAADRLLDFKPRDDPRAIKSAAIKYANGTIKIGPSHAIISGGDTVPRGAKDGFVTNDGEFLNAEQAHKRAKEFGQIGPYAMSPLISEDLPMTPDQFDFKPAKPKTNEDVARLEASYNAANPDAVPLTYKKDAEGNYIIKNGQPVENTTPYDLMNTPKALKATEGIEGKEEKRAAVVKTLSKALTQYYEKVKDNPDINKAIGWYKGVRHTLRPLFDSDEEMWKFCQLMGATSPNLEPRPNFEQAIDAFNGVKSGRFDDLIRRAKELRDKGELEYSDEYLRKNNLLPLQSELSAEGKPKQYGINSKNVLKVLLDDWESTAPLKTGDYAGNFSSGKTLKAVIDQWAARTARRMLGGQRITSKGEAKVSDPDYLLAQEAFTNAAKKAGIDPDDMQAILWFAEKDFWEKSGFNTATKGDVRPFMAAAARGPLGDIKIDYSKVDRSELGVGERKAIERMESGKKLNDEHKRILAKFGYKP